MDDKVVFVATPGSGMLHHGMARAVWQSGSEHRQLMPMSVHSSLIQMNCNGLLAIALNLREQENLGWFAMLHSDVVPEPLWIDTLINIANDRKADFVSCVIPIKNNSGCTSTAYSDPCDPSAITRLNLREIMELPETFGLADLDQPAGTDLLLNTGCCVLRLGDWIDPAKVFFHCEDRISKDFAGNWVAHTFPEDWFFSRSVARVGGKTLATRSLVIDHYDGNTRYRNRL